MFSVGFTVHKSVRDNVIDFSIRTHLHTFLQIKKQLIHTDLQTTRSCKKSKSLENMEEITDKTPRRHVEILMGK